MPLIKDGRVVPHNWHLVGEDTSLPPGDIVLPLEKLLAHEQTWRLRPGELGVEISGDTDLAVLAPWFDRLSLIVVRFGGFADGRGFSLARHLRTKHGYSGALWAGGPLIADQYSFAVQCGFDAVLLDEAVFARQGAPMWEEAANALSLSYQAGLPANAGRVGQPRSLLALRQAARYSQAAE